MALTWNRVQQEAQAVQEMSERLLVLLSDMNKLLAHNSAQAIDWGAGSTPAYIEEDTAENLSGMTYTRQQVSNAIGTFAFFTGETSHIGNLNLLARP